MTASNTAKPRHPMLDTDLRPDTRERTLMFVADVRNGMFELSMVGEPTTKANIPHNVPDDVARRLIGRQVWLLGGWGGGAVLGKWVDLPVFAGKPL